MKNIFFSLAVIFFLASTSEATVPCGTVDMKAAACVGYATGKEPKPSPACCSGLQQLAGTVKTVDDKKNICRCLKNGVKAFAGVQDKFLSQIPANPLNCNGIDAEIGGTSAHLGMMQDGKGSVYQMPQQEKSEKQLNAPDRFNHEEHLLLYVFLLSFLLFLASTSEATVPCGTVDMKAAACVGYATGKQPKPSPACCSGLQQLAATVKTVDDKKNICRCLKNGVRRSQAFRTGS
ncbi:Non-specific lipid-transfer protein C, cotyledon-specific isoform [Vitis vinifera]|uniref:Non-specific lipid-transfer protein n=1 Tax=Vitis vinifera TaxID=29760 RepID=A0A438IUQ2_VITVI|nr:Non-specific lipid-transfer protein C, cotyledon-specific isoform [Vitis vinifera]